MLSWTGSRGRRESRSTERTFSSIGLSMNQSVDAAQSESRARQRESGAIPYAQRTGDRSHTRACFRRATTCAPPPDSREADPASCLLPWRRFRPSMTRFTIISHFKLPKTLLPCSTLPLAVNSLVDRHTVSRAPRFPRGLACA